MVEIKEGIVKIDNPTTEIHIWVEKAKECKGGFKEKARILKVNQDSLNRVYITVS